MSFLDKIKNSFTDNTGWFRNKRFTPLQQLQDINTSRIPAVNNSFQNQNMSLNGLPQQKLVINQPQQQTQLPTLEPPKPVFKTDAADRLSSRLDAIKKFGTSDPAKIVGESAVKQEGKNFWDTGIGTGLVKAQKAVNDQIDIQKRDFAPGGAYNNAYQTIKENPVLTSSLERFEKVAPSFKKNLEMGIKEKNAMFNPFQNKEKKLQSLDEIQNYRDSGEAWQDTKNIASAGLTAFGLAKAPLTAMLGGAVISPISKMVTNVYENKKGEQYNQQLSQIGQSRTDIPLFAQPKPYQQKKITEGVVDAIPEGAGTGLANSGTTRLTNYIVQSFASVIPILKPLTEKAISNSAPVVTDSIKDGVNKLLNTGGKRILKSVILETAIETPIWATLTQTEQESYLQAIEREAVQNLVMNIGMAGVNTLGDAKALLPIIKRSIDTSVSNYWKNASTPEALEAQSGKINLGADVGGESEVDYYNRVGKYEQSTVNLPSKKVYVNPNDLTLEQKKFLNNETKNIPDYESFTAEDNVHFNDKDILKRGESSNETKMVSLEEARKLSPNLDNLLKKFDSQSQPNIGGVSTPQNKLYSIAEEFDNPEDFIAHYRGSATQYNKYTPEIRKYGTTENSTRISDLGIDPNRKITIYRGIDDVENKVKNPKINDGDFITTDKDSAGSYTGGTIVSKEVRAKDLITDFPDEFDVKDPFYTGAEFIYSDSKNKLIKYTDNDLRNIFDQSKKLGLNKIKQNSAEASKSLAYKNQYGFFKMGDKLVNDIETKIKSSYPEDYFTGNNYNKLGELITKELDNIVSPVKSQISPEVTHKTELDWLKENNQKNNSIVDIKNILDNRKTEVGKAGDITGLGAEDSRPLPPKPKPFVDYKKQDTEILKSLAKQEPDTKELFNSDRNAGEIKSPSITSNRPDLTNEKLNKGFGEIDDLHTIDPKTGKLISKTEPKTSKVTTPPEIVNPKPSSEVAEPKIEEILSPQEQKVRAENEIMMERFRNGEFSKEKPNKINTIFDGQETKLKYKDANIDKIKDVRLRAQIKNAMSFDQWVDDNNIKNADAKSNEKWLQVKKIENEIAPKKSKPIKEVLTKPVVASEQEVKTTIEKKSAHDQENLSYHERKYYRGLQGKALDEYLKTGKLPKAQQAFGGDYSMSSDYETAKDYAGENGAVVELKIDKDSGISEADPFDKRSLEDNWNDLQDIGEGEMIVNNPDLVKVVGIEKLTETKPIVEPKAKPETKVEEPKRTAKPLPPETKHYSKEVVDKVVDFENRVVKIGELAQKEGVSLAPDNIKRVLNGEVKVSPELKTQIEGIQTELRQGEIEIGNEGALKAGPHVSDVDIRRTDTELTSKETFDNLVLGSTFNASKKNTGSVPNEYKADWVDASIAENRYITRTKNESDILAGKIVEENNIPKEKIEDVKKIVETQKTVLEESNKEARKSYDKGKQSKIDYLKIEADKENSLNALSGSKKTRPIWKADDNKSGNIGTKKTSLDDQFRTEATFFRDKTPPEVYDALVELRLAEKGTGEMNYTTALRNFYNVATKYDYESGTTRDGVNHYINRRISTNKIVQSNVDKAIRAMSRQLSRSQIQHNIKVAVEQPFEVLRLAADNGYGIKKMFKAIRKSFNPTEFKRIVKEAGLESEKSGNVPIKEVLAKQEDISGGKIKQGFKKLVDASDNIGYKGVASTENWKNVVFSLAAEDAGIEKGLKGNELKKFIEKENIRIAHISDAGMTPRIMESAKGAGLLQYQQYSSKQNILLWNTLSGDLSLGKKAGQTIKYLMADYTAKATLAAVTGVKAVDFGKWVYEMVKPKLGPLLTIPYQMAENQYSYMKLDDEEKEKTPNPLTGSSLDTLKVAVTPGGVQFIAKTAKVADILKDNYQLSKKGNVNYVAGDMSTFDKARALMFGAGAIPNKKEADKRWSNLKKDGIYPTLTAEQSEVLKSLPKDEQEAYYNDKMAEQVSAKEIVDAEEKPKKKGIMGIFGKKEEEVPKKTVSDILSSDTATQKEKSKAKSIIKEKLDSGRLDSTNTSDNDLRAYFFSEVDEMPENDEIEKHEKTLEKWKKINSVIESDTLDKDTKDRIIKISGESKEDIDYYKKASMDNASRQRVLVTLASQEDREKVIESLILSKKSVGGKAIVAGSSEIDYLYDQGYISKEEKNFINSYKFDEIAGKFYQDRDYKNKMSGDASASLAKSQKEYAALLEKLRNIDENTASSTTKLSKSINDILGSEQKKTTSSLSKILRSKNIGGNQTTQFTNNLGKIKRVKAQYYY